MDRAKVAVLLFGCFGMVTIAQAIGLAAMAGFEPQLSLFFAGGLLISGVAVHTLYTDRHEEFAVFRRRDLLFRGLVVGVAGYTVGVSIQFV